MNTCVKMSDQEIAEKIFEFGPILPLKKNMIQIIVIWVIKQSALTKQIQWGMEKII